MSKSIEDLRRQFATALGVEELTGYVKVFEYVISRDNIEKWYNPHEVIDPEAKGLITLTPMQSLNRFIKPSDNLKEMLVSNGMPSEYKFSLNHHEHSTGYVLTLYGVLKP